jgi:hypothetical protein
MKSYVVLRVVVSPVCPVGPVHETLVSAVRFCQQSAAAENVTLDSFAIRELGRRVQTSEMVRAQLAADAQV